MSATTGLIEQGSYAASVRMTPRATSVAPQPDVACRTLLSLIPNENLVHVALEDEEGMRGVG